MQEYVGNDGDTVKLLRECDAGAKMGIDSINDVVNEVSDSQFQQLLTDCRNEHERLSAEVSELLDLHRDEGKMPNPMARGMSWIKTNAKMMADPTDATIADLMTDGCNMGVKSLSRYLNQYKSADEKSKDIAEQLVNLELQLTNDIRQYL
ncbi:MAG: hypothetical protein J5964_00690 [Eubacterium sp.]|nr:hypothetical protein [Eubacterium sp.]